MELRHLRYFVSVGEEQHFGRAAARLHVAQPAVSRQIQDLEKELGFLLFDRLPRGVRLNAAGQLTSNSRGVFGLQGVNLNSASGSVAQGSLITSAGKSMHLDSGTQMLLVTQAATAAETPKP